MAILPGIRWAVVYLKKYYLCYQNLGTWGILRCIILFFFSCFIYSLFVCLYESLCVGTCVGGWMREGWHRVSLSGPLHVSFEACAAIDLEPCSPLGEYQWSTCLHFPIATITSMWCFTQFCCCCCLNVGTGHQTHILMLNSKPLPDWAISMAPIFTFIHFVKVERKYKS